MENERKEELKEEKLLFWRELAVSHMNNLGLFPLLSAYLALFSKDFYAALFFWIPMGFVPFVFYLLRRRCDNGFVLLLTHVLVIGGVGVFFWAAPCREFCIMAAICYMIYSFLIYARTFDQLDGSVSVMAATGLSLIVSLVIAVEKDTVFGSFDKMLAAALILYFGLYFFSGFIEKFCNFLVVSKNSAGHIPKEEIFRSGTQMTAASIAFITVILFFAADISLIKNLIRIVREMIFSLIRFLLSLIDQKTPETDPIYFQEELRRPQMPNFPTGESYHGFLWELLTLAAAVFVMAAFLSFLIFALKRVIRFFQSKAKREKIQFLEGKEENLEDQRESCRTEHSKTGLSIPDLKPAFLLDPNEKIRRFYKLFIRKNAELIKPMDPAFLTAKESVHRLERDQMAEIYEKARYSGEECTNYDYTLFKEMSRHKNEEM